MDIGLVGEIVATNPGAIEALLADGRIPVVSSVAAGQDGEVYNVNADTAAAALAVALDAAKLVVLTDVAGLYRDWPSSAEVISELTAAELERLLPGLSAGMIPKMEACLTAVRGGVPQAHVLDGRLSHAVLLEIFTDSGIGTMVIPSDEREGNRQSMSETEAPSAAKQKHSRSGSRRRSCRTTACPRWPSAAGRAAGYGTPTGASTWT